LARFVIVAVVVVALALTVQAVYVANAQVVAAATTNGFGAAFGYSQTIGSIAYTQAGSIGNGTAAAAALTPGHYTYQYDPSTHHYNYVFVSGQSAESAVLSAGNAAAFAQAMGTPFGSNAFIQATSFNGLASAYAGAN